MRENELAVVKKDGNEAVSQPPPSLRRGEGPGIKIVTMNKVGDEIITRSFAFSFRLICSRRDVFKANVFGSSIAPPTMTLEEFAELEIAGAREREEKERLAQQEKPSGRRYNQLVADGDEDDIDLVDAVIIHLTFFRSHLSLHSRQNMIVIGMTGRRLILEDQGIKWERDFRDSRCLIIIVHFSSIPPALASRALSL
jgi:hypothetical protein